MSGFGGWVNPNGAIHYVRPGDQVISMGTGMSASSFCSMPLGPMYRSAHDYSRAVVVDPAPDLGDLWLE